MDGKSNAGQPDEGRDQPGDRLINRDPSLIDEESNGALDSMLDKHTATDALVDSAKGSRQAINELMPLVMDRLRGLAHRRLNQEGPGSPFDPTELVNEVYLKLIDYTRVNYQGKTHFFAIASRGMRQVIIDYARMMKAEKRGGERHRVTFSDLKDADKSTPVDLVELGEALEELGKKSERLVKIAEMRLFSGLSLAEISAELHLSIGTIHDGWTEARARLASFLTHR